MTKLLKFLSLPILFVALSLSITGCSGGSSRSATTNGGGSTTQTPAPAVTGVSPASVPAGSEAFTLTVTGSNFQPQSAIKWNSTALTTTYGNATTLTATVPANLAASTLVANVTVANPDGQVSVGGSSSQQVLVTNPKPTLTGITPNSLYAGSADTTFTLTGANFSSLSVVASGTTSLATTLVGSTQLTAVAPAALLASVGTLSLTVSNPAPGGGSSQSVAVSLLQHPAELDSLAPSTVPLSNSPQTVTLSGSYFTPTTVVYASGTALSTHFISTTSIQFTVPASLISYTTGTIPIAVVDSASGVKGDNTVTLPIVNPVPVLNSLSAMAVTAGAPDFLLVLNGSNFLQSSTILINGTAVQPFSTGQLSAVATVTVPASVLSTVGPVTIAVSNPAPGGGTSQAQTLNVISASNRVRTVNVAAADLGWDSVHNVLVASTLSSSTNNPNSIVTIDPLQGTVIASQTLPSQPAGISVTSDGTYIYATLPSTGQIERLILPSLTPDITFALGEGANGVMNTTAAVTAAPGKPHTVAVSLHTGDTNPESAVGGVAVYDDGISRAAIVGPPAYPNVYDTLVWGKDSTTLYGTDSAYSGGPEDVFSVTASGITLAQTYTGALGDFVKHLAYDPSTGNLIDGYGHILNAATGQSMGLLQVQNTLSNGQNPFALDTAQRVGFYVNVNSSYSSNPAPNGEYIQAFGLDRFNYINSMLVEGLEGASTIVRWGASGLAANGASQVYLIDGSFVTPTGVTSAVGGFVAPSPTLALVTPVSVAVGSADTQVTLTGRDFTQSSQVTWNNQNLLIDSISDTQMVVTIPAAALGQPVASLLAVSNGPGTGSSNSIGFTVVPNLGANAQMQVLNVSGNDLAWDAARNLLYVSVPAGDPISPNTIAVIDPVAAAVRQMIPVADQPSTIALSDDGSYLYAGFSGQAIVQQYSLPSFSLSLTIPMGAGATGTVGTQGSCAFPAAMKVAPGNPQTIAVSEGIANVEPNGCLLAIYDNATARPNTLSYYTSGVEFSSLAWGADANTLYGQVQNGISPQEIYSVTVSPSGVSPANGLNSGGFGLQVHFDPGTKLLYSDSGVITNPVGPVQVGKFDSGQGVLVATDSALKRAFVLTSSSTVGINNSGQGANSYTLNIYDLNTQALLKTIAIPDVLGAPVRLVRWGTKGLVFVTSNWPSEGTTVGALYILQGSDISGTP
ncbi:hypothetical protein RBB79_19045 [Tunturiibacter empetritectus]|uniref:IPT/TIG domain-containing protein n=1 Tax=Tunturiibacter lichenicola TaxID=2051959 RepID=A0A852VR03_9BACT|nr:IPT/TIG domain-containing protein [Edaphobacter lichenicola]NYF91762.1 hypothetical protein [Edaphobacter lichenicola]